MTPSTFDDIPKEINKDGMLTGIKTVMQDPVPEYIALAIAIRRLSMNSTYQQLSERFGYGQSTCQKCYEKVIQATLILEKKVIKRFRKNEMKKTMWKILKQTGLPFCAGYLDGTSFPMAYQPQEASQDYWCRKGFYGIAAQIHVDEKGIIKNLFVGLPAGQHDATLYKRSSLGKLQSEDIYLPKVKRFDLNHQSGENVDKISPYIVARVPFVWLKQSILVLPMVVVTSFASHALSNMHNIIMFVVVLIVESSTPKSLNIISSTQQCIKWKL
jgi:hypothetical protein